MGRKLTAAQAAEIADCQTQTVRGWCRDGKLPAERESNMAGFDYYVIDEDDLRSFLADPARRDRRFKRADD